MDTSDDLEIFEILEILKNRKINGIDLFNFLDFRFFSEIQIMVKNCIFERCLNLERKLNKDLALSFFWFLLT